MTPISVSSLMTWQRCKRLYYYRDVLQLEPKRERTGLQLIRGKIIHRLQQARLTSRNIESAVNEEFKKEKDIVLREFKNEDIERREQLNKMLFSIETVFAEVLKEPPPLTRVIAEKYLEVKLPSGRKFTGQVDAYGTLRNSTLWAVYELKTSSLSDSSRIDHITERFRPQVPLYVYALKKYNIPITHIYRDFILCPTMNVPEKNLNGTMSQKNIMCTWDVYKKELAKANLPVKDYEEMKKKLQFKPTYFFKTKVNETLIRTFVDVIETESSAIDKEKVFSPSWGSACSFCEFKEPCFQRMTGDDEQHTLLAHYKNRESHYASTDEA